MIITQEQKNILMKYDVVVYDDVNDTLMELDDKITEIGFNKDYTLNKIGFELQKLYDDLYYQN